jgi:hypothetical protein
MIDPGTENQVTTADTMTLIGESVVRDFSGTLYFNGGFGMSIENSLFDLRIGNDNISITRQSPMIVTTAETRISEGGRFIVRRTESPAIGVYYTNIPIFINGGLFYIGETVQVAVTGQLSVPAEVSVYQSSGVLRMDEGSRLVCTYGYTLHGGEFTAMPSVIGDIVTIQGNVVVLDGLISISAPNAGHIFGTIAIEGNLTFSGGTFLAYIDGADQSKSDLLYCTGTMLFDGEEGLAKLGLMVLHEASAMSNWKWNVLKSDTSITYLPTLEGPYTTDYDLVGDGNAPCLDGYAEKK